ncbi:hypothetical protein D3C76_1211490 [compost metagenome]
MAKANNYANNTSLNNISLLSSSLSYNIGQISTHIYFNGSVTIKTYPTGGSSGSFIYATVYEVGAQYGGGVGSRSLSGTSNDSWTINHLYGYHYVRADSADVVGENTVSGTYKIEY